MVVLLMLLIILAILFLLYLFILRGRNGHPGLEKLRGWAYAHRGLHGNGVPENSMEAFRLALEGGYGIEFDVHLMADGNLAVIHDPSLMRTAGADVMIEELRTGDLEHYRLEGTEEKIPTFRQLLDLYDGKAPLIIELKAEKGNQAALCDAVCKALDGYNGAYCIESFDPRCVKWLRQNRPDVLRGQLSENFFRSRSSKLHPVLKFVMTHYLVNLVARPDFVAYRFSDRNMLGAWLCRRVWRMQGVSWTVRSKKDYDIAVKEGWIPIFENFTP